MRFIYNEGEELVKKPEVRITEINLRLKRLRLLRQLMPEQEKPEFDMMIQEFEEEKDLLQMRKEK